MPIKGGYLLAAGGGAVLLWSGIRGKKWSDALRMIISGQDPRTALTAYSITTAPAAFSTAAGVDSTAVAAHGTAGPVGDAIASSVEEIAPHYHYVFGGVPANGVVDCSSLINEGVARIGLAIPMYKAGTYKGTTHGPATLVWLVWTGCFTIKRKDAARGDLAVWQTHMGVFTDSGHILAAHDPTDGISVTTVADAGPGGGEIMVVRRFKAVTA